MSTGLIALAVSLTGLWIGDMIWAAGSGVRFAGLGNLVATMLLMLLNAAIYKRLRAGERVADLTLGFALFFALATGTGALSYLAATLGRPFADPWLSRADAALGFDWLLWWSFVQSRPLLHVILHAAYLTMMPQIFLCLVTLPLAGMAARSRELVVALAISMVPTLILFALFPAQCAWSYYAVQPDAPAAFLADLMALRSGALPVLDLQQIHGLVTFPSYHTISAILLAYAARGTPWMFLSGVVNGLMIISTLSEGGHYLTDVITGAILAIVTIAAIRLWSQAGHRMAEPDAAAV